MQIKATRVYDTDGDVSAVAANATASAPLPATTSVSGDPSPGLFFQIPDTSASTKKVLAHYFMPGIRSVDNLPGASDYFKTNFLTPTGEGGKHVAYGGWWRDRPWPRAARTGSWQLADADEDIVVAQSVGIDGFFCNIMGADHVMYSSARTAANTSHPGFLVVPMLDFAVGVGTAQNAAALCSAYNLTNSRYNRDGAMILSTFYAEAQQPSYYQTLINTMASSYGITAKFLFIFLNHATYASYSSMAIGTGVWGTAEPSQYGDPARSGLGCIPVRHSDTRPYQSSWWENANFTVLRQSWDKAISADAEYVQMVTWSDFVENAAMCPTPGMGRVLMDISAWYIAWWKTGTPPPILRDAIYLSHRNHVQGATIVGPQTSFMTNKIGSTPMTYNIEAMVFLTAPATVEITNGGTTASFSAPAGMSYHTKTAAAGATSSRVVRDGVTTASIISPVPIRSTVWVDSRNYYCCGSIRGTAGQFDPTFTSAGAAPTYPAYVPI